MGVVPRPQSESDLGDSDPLDLDDGGCWSGRVFQHWKLSSKIGSVLIYTTDLVTFGNVTCIIPAIRAKHPDFSLLVIHS